MLVLLSYIEGFRTAANTPQAGPRGSISAVSSLHEVTKTGNHEEKWNAKWFLSFCRCNEFFLWFFLKPLFAFSINELRGRCAFSVAFLSYKTFITFSLNKLMNILHKYAFYRVCWFGMAFTFWSLDEMIIYSAYCCKSWGRGYRLILC